jgi:hypothetical protein
MNERTRLVEELSRTFSIVPRQDASFLASVKFSSPDGLFPRPIDIVPRQTRIERKIELKSLDFASLV